MYATATSPLGITQINVGDVTLNNQVHVNNINFTSSQSATLTFANTHVVCVATTTGNKIHTLAITSDLTKPGTIGRLVHAQITLKPCSLTVTVKSQSTVKIFTLV